jgi:hypothetical protein
MSPWPGACACVLLLFALIAAVLMIVEAVRGRRNDKQIDAERALRRGFRAADRMGWLPDDCQ